ncbi:MAG: dihydroneopterin triphosphate diphosphatase [Zoogloeaceae bacterium]|jgi:dATP pyrophosphohydrolase|nr:dihydroneopterin triphosphate diphosphatase [Zoogloeaceae bacterium]
MYKRPVSVLVVIHTPDLQMLLLERVLHPGYWQSVTGSLETGETPAEAALREVAEETGIIVPPQQFRDWQQCWEYEIFPEWRDRYAPGVTRNTEHVFSLQLPARVEIRLAPDEHRAFCWLPAKEAATRCFSPSNQRAILTLPEILRGTMPQQTENSLPPEA